MSYIPSEEELNQYENENPSFGRKAMDYEQGLLAQLLQSGANAGYHLGMSPSYAYEAITGKPGYSLTKPDISEFIPESEAGQTGKQVGETVSDLASFLVPGRIAGRGVSALSRFHPFTKGQMRRQFQQPINAAEQAGVRAPMSYRQLQELSDLLSHPALEARGGAGRSLTPQGRGAIIEGGTQGRISALHSAQSLLGDLERSIPGMGESYLASTRVRPMKEQLLEHIQQGMREAGLPEEAENYQNARQAARRYYNTKRAVKSVVKPISWIAALKMAMSAAKGLP